MTTGKIKLLDTVALLEDLPERGLKHGEVGTVVEILATDVYEVEFCDDGGKTYAEFALRGDQLLMLHSEGEATSLKKTMDELSRSSQEKGLTLEILESILEEG